MLIRLGNDEFILNNRDVIFFNGTSFFLITRKVGIWWEKHSPSIPYRVVKELIDKGHIREFEHDDPPYTHETYKYYRLT